MEKAVLNVEKREKNGLKGLREGGKVPAVFYGRKEKTSSITVSEKDFVKVWKEAGESAIISLHGEGTDVDAIIHEVQVHPVTERPLHVDFYVIEKDRKITVAVPLEFVGESPAEKAGHILVKILHELEIEALPGNLPQNIEVDVLGLAELGDSISVGDLKLPEGVEAMMDKDEAVVNIAEAREEEPEEPVEAPDMDSIEVEQKGKGEEGAEGEDETKEDLPASKAGKKEDSV